MAPSRRLTAIVFTDMVGFTASVQADESTALALRREQQDLVRSEVMAFRGREVKSTGDGLLLEFDSALTATECAISIQRRIHERNGRTGTAPILLRIGIHLGDVHQEGSDIFGDSVNIAARLQPVAAPGGICISGSVRDQIWNKISNRLDKLPPTELKGIRAPTDLYRIALPWKDLESVPPEPEPTRLAVLPFANLSQDPTDLYFADGLTEELITVLSQIRELRIIARTSVMQYKSTAKAVPEIGQELSVKSILEGSVRRAGNRLRITAQLIDVRTQAHVWATSYDRELDDVFLIQSDIAKRVAESLRVELLPSERARIESKPTTTPASHVAYLKGLALSRGATRASLEAARRQYELAVKLDPANAPAHAGLAAIHWYIGIWLTDLARADWIEQMAVSARRALELDPELAEAHEAMSMLLWREQDYAGMERELQTAIAINPSFAAAHSSYANLLEVLGRPEEAVREFRLAESLDPLWANNLSQLVWLLLALSRFDEAWLSLQKLGAVAEDWSEYHWLLGNYHFARSDTSRALGEYRRAYELETEPRFEPIYRAWYYLRAGETEKLRTLLDAEAALPEFGQNPTWVAKIYAELGDLDACFLWLEKSRRSHDLPVMLIRLDPVNENVRRDPRYVELLGRMKLS